MLKGHIASTVHLRGGEGAGCEVRYLIYSLVFSKIESLATEVENEDDEETKEAIFIIW